MFNFFNNYELLKKLSLAASVVGILIAIFFFIIASFWFQVPNPRDFLCLEQYTANIIVVCSIIALFSQSLVLILSKKNIPFLKSHAIKVRIQLAMDMVSACAFLTVFFISCAFIPYYDKLIPDQDWTDVYPEFKRYYYSLWVQVTAGFILSLLVIITNFLFRLLKLQRVGKSECLMESQISDNLQ